MNSVGGHSGVREIFDGTLCEDPDIEFAVAFG